MVQRHFLKKYMVQAHHLKQNMVQFHHMKNHICQVHLKGQHIIPSLSNKNATVSASSISAGHSKHRRCIGIGTRVTDHTRYVHWMHKLMNKPVIYLYPTEPLDISVRLSIKDSKFSAVYPRFNGKNTWNVHAKPNGEISIKDKKYPYCFGNHIHMLTKKQMKDLWSKMKMLKNSLKKNWKFLD